MLLLSSLCKCLENRPVGVDAHSPSDLQPGPRKRRVFRFLCNEAPVEGEGFVSQRPCARPCASAIKAREPRGDGQRALLPALEQGWWQRHTRCAGTCDGFSREKEICVAGKGSGSPSLLHLLHVAAMRLSRRAGQVRRTCTRFLPRHLPWERLFRATVLSIASRGRTMVSAGPASFGSRRIGVAMSRPRRGRDVGGALPDRCGNGTGDGIRPGRAGCRGMSGPSFSVCLAKCHLRFVPIWPVLFCAVPATKTAIVGGD